MVDWEFYCSGPSNRRPIRFVAATVEAMVVVVRVGVLAEVRVGAAMAEALAVAMVVVALGEALAVALAWVAAKE